MTPCEYKAKNGSRKLLDLDTVVDVAIGRSAVRPQWTATIVFDAKTTSFIELRSSPPDYGGNSAEEAEEVSREYIEATFHITAIELNAARRLSQDWSVIRRR